MKLGRRSKPSNKKGVLTRPKSRTQANIAGYEKRLARKAKSNPLITDLYEHVPEKSHRSKVALDLSRDEEFEFQDGDDEEEERERLRARLIGENEDDEKIASDDDEEVDSDAAFEESDEERFEGFFSHKKKAHFKSKKKKMPDSVDVDLGEEDDGDGVEMDDRDDEDDSEEEDEEEEGDDNEMVNLLDFDPSDSDMPEALDHLNEFVSNLDVASTKRKATEDPSEIGASKDTRARKRRLERTEAGAENEFRTRFSGSKLNLDDLLSPLASQSSALQSLKTSAKVLGSSSSKAKILSAPLPQRTQERLDREAAYEQTKEEVDKWSETMRHIRTAEHLSFPLQSQSTGRVSNLELTAKFKPTTALESSVDALLKSSGLKDEDIHHTEEAMLQMNELSSEEVAQRRGELRKMRELMFRAEVKARREGKIKSKTYRRIKRKEKERTGEKIDKDNVEGEEVIDKEEINEPNWQYSLATPSIRESDSNPWLTRISEPIVKLRNQARKGEEVREIAKEDGVVEISLDKVLTFPSAPSDSNPSETVRKVDRRLLTKTSQQSSVVQADEDESDSDGETGAQEAALVLKGKKKEGGIKAFVAVAFAGDNVVQNFEEAKIREIASDAPREVDTTIPGWGSWGGVGVRKLPPKPQRIKKIAGIDPTTRADFNKKHIIISEKRDKKAGKYLVKDLPYPYTSKAQFERAMENPLGAEWNTRVAFQRGTLPKVVKKPGVIINPLEKLTS